MKVASADEIVDIVKEKQLYIYGAGFVAKRFFRGLQMRGLENKVEAFITTDGRAESLFGKDVKSIDEILPLKEDCLICIAVAHAALEDISNKLEELKVDDYIWIFPYLPEFLLGKFIKKNVFVELVHIWQANRDRMGIPVRYLAMEEFLGRNKIGYDLYKKTMNLCSTEEITGKRLASYKEMLRHKWNEGCMPNEPISLMEHGLIVDGLHRTTVALFLGYKEIIGNIYYDSEEYAKEYLRLSNPRLQEAEILGYSIDEIVAIKRVQKILDDRYL